MANKITCRVDFDTNAIAEPVAKLNDKQVANYQTTAQRLRSDLTYVVPKQWVHSEKVTVNGRESKSNKIFAIGVDSNGNAITAVSLSVNGLRNRHYGKVKDNPALKIKAEQRDGLWRAVQGTSQESVFSQGALPMTVIGDTAYINRNFAFKIVGRESCYGVNFTEQSAGKWNINHHTENGVEYVTLSSSTLNEYAELDNIPSVDSNACIPNFDTYTADLP